MLFNSMIREESYHNLYVRSFRPFTGVARLSLVDVVRSGTPLINENPCFILFIEWFSVT